MVEVTCDGGITRIEEEGFALLIHDSDGKMYALHPCTNAGYLDKDGFNPKKAALLFSEILEERCLDCGDISLPDELKSIWYLYNFDRIQKGRW